MNPLRSVCLLMGIIALAAANSNNGPRPMSMNSNSIKSSLKPANWVSASQLDSLPSVNQVTLNKLEEMSVNEGADLLNQIYHLSQVGPAFQPNYSPSLNEIPAFLITPDNQKVTFTLNQLSSVVKQQQQFGDQEVTILITGLPSTTETVKKANRKLIAAYIQRYNNQVPQQASTKYVDEDSTQSAENSNNAQQNQPSGNLIVINLGDTISDFNSYASLDVEGVGAKIGNVLVELTDNNDVPHEIIHVIGNNVAAHVAGAAARQYTRVTGHQLRRVTGLDPSKLYSKRPNTVTGLARGDADFVDVIHTSAYGMGTPIRSGDADFYVNGPSAGVPGSDNVVEASTRATRYFAESVVPGNERNFPAVGASSLRDYNNKNGIGKRVYMGINTDFDVEGDFVLKVNAKSPFGRNAPAEKQEYYHQKHQPWNMYAQNHN